MKKKFLVILPLIGMFLGACGEPAPTPVTGVTLSESSVTFNIGETKQLTATVTPDNATNKNVTWAANNDNVTVANGLVTAMKAGTSEVTVTTVDGGKTAKCNFTINTPTPIGDKMTVSIGGAAAREMSKDDSGQYYLTNVALSAGATLNFNYKGEAYVPTVKSDDGNNARIDNNQIKVITNLPATEGKGIWLDLNAGLWVDGYQSPTPVTAVVKVSIGGGAEQEMSYNSEDSQYSLTNVALPADAVLAFTKDGQSYTPRVKSDEGNNARLDNNQIKVICTYPATEGHGLWLNLEAGLWVDGYQEPAPAVLTVKVGAAESTVMSYVAASNEYCLTNIKLEAGTELSFTKDADPYNPEVKSDEGNNVKFENKVYSVIATLEAEEEKGIWLSLTKGLWVHGPETPAVDALKVSIGGEPAVDMKYNSGSNEYCLTNISLSAGDELQFTKNGEKYVPQVKPDVDENINNVKYENEKITVKCDLEAEEEKGIWLSLTKGLWVNGYQAPVIADYVVHGAFEGSSEWTDKQMTINPHWDTEYMIKDVYMKEGDKFVIHMSGNTWYKANDLKLNCEGDLSSDEDGNILVTKDGQYTIYADSVADADEKHVYVSYDTVDHYGYIINDSFRSLGSDPNKTYAFTEDIKQLPPQGLKLFVASRHLQEEPVKAIFDDSDVTIDDSVSESFEFVEEDSSLLVKGTGKFTFTLEFVEGVGNSVLVEAYEEPVCEYSYALNEEKFVPMVDDTDNMPEEQNLIAQYKAEGIDVTAEDLVNFKKGEESIFPGASEGENNVFYDNKKLTVISTAEDVNLYLKVYSDGGYSVWLEGFKSPTPETVYTLKVNNGEAITMTDASSEKQKGDLWKEQYVATVSAEEGQTITFFKNGEAIYPGASGFGNNLSFNDNTLTVICTCEEQKLYLKVFDNSGVEGYDTWFFGNVLPTEAYLKPSSEWLSDGATFAAYFFEEGKDPVYKNATYDEKTSTYKVELPEGYTNMIWVRVNPAKNFEVDHWGENVVWTQTQDLKVPSDKNVKYTVSGWDSGSWGTL